MGDAITITSAGGVLEATFVPSLGMIASSLRHGGDELFHQGQGLANYAKHGSLFALPLLYPWADRLSAWEFELAGRKVRLDPASPVARRDPTTGLPIHGLLATCSRWSVVDRGHSALSAELEFGAVQECMEAFPFPHRLRYHASISDRALTITLTVAATEICVPVSFGFHPYLTLPGSDRRDWQVTMPAARQLVLDEHMIPTGDAIQIVPGLLDGPLADRVFDVCFDRLRATRCGRGSSTVGSRLTADCERDHPTFALADDRRRVGLSPLDGYPVAEVYAPEDSDFLCYEPLTAPPNALLAGDGLRWVAPGESFSAAFEIAVQSIDQNR